MSRADKTPEQLARDQRVGWIGLVLVLVFAFLALAVWTAPFAFPAKAALTAALIGVLFGAPFYFRR